MKGLKGGQAYNRALNTMSVEDRSVGKHGYLGKGHPLEDPSCQMSPCPPSGRMGSHGAGRGDGQKSESNIGPGGDGQGKIKKVNENYGR